MSFLTAEWRKLAMVNYAIDPGLLAPYVPAGTELDEWNGTHYVSLIGFMFVNTRVLGVKVPFHVDFEEVNLRFYVRHRDENGNWTRGVVFIKEIVPLPAITFVANTVYGEHYVTHQMKHRWTTEGLQQSVAYEWKNGPQWNGFTLKAGNHPMPIEEGSEAEFITEHYWGYTSLGARKTAAYEVTHPRWEQYPVSEYQLNVDFGLNYGEEFAFLKRETPRSVILAEGSAITVEGKRVFKV